MNRRSVLTVSGMDLEIEDPTIIEGRLKNISGIPWVRGFFSPAGNQPGTLRVVSAEHLILPHGGQPK